MNIVNAVGGVTRFMLKTAVAAKDRVTYSSLAEVLSALCVYPLCREQITVGRVSLHDPVSVIALLITATVFFYVFRSAGRALLGQFIYPDTPIWGELPDLSESEFECLIEHMERMTRDQARTAHNRARMILDQYEASHQQEESAGR